MSVSWSSFLPYLIVMATVTYLIRMLPLTVFRKEIKAAEDPAAKRAELLASYEARFASPYVAAERGFVDMVIKPSDTRALIIDGLDALEGKGVRDIHHGNIPL